MRADRVQPKGPILEGRAPDEELHAALRLVLAARAAAIHAVNDVDLSLPAGKTLGPRGRVRLRQDHRVEDDHAGAQAQCRHACCSTTARARRTCIKLEGEELTAYRRSVQFVFQDPFSSLNPRMTVYEHPDRAAAHPRHRHVRTSATSGSSSCSTWSASTSARCGAIRIPSPAASGSASASPARWRSSRACCSATSRSRRSTSRCRRRC